VLKHTNTYSKADLTDKQLSQEQKHGQQYFLDIRPHKLVNFGELTVKYTVCRLIPVLSQSTLRPLGWAYTVGDLAARQLTALTAASTGHER